MFDIGTEFLTFETKRKRHKRKLRVARELGPVTDQMTVAWRLRAVIAFSYTFFTDVIGITETLSDNEPGLILIVETSSLMLR